MELAEVNAAIAQLQWPLTIKPINHGQCPAVCNDATTPLALPFPASSFPQPSTTLLSSDDVCFDCQLELAEVTTVIAQLQWPLTIKPIIHGQCPAACHTATLPFTSPSQHNNSHQPSATLLSGDASCFDYQSELAAATAAIAWLNWPSMIKLINHGQCPATHHDKTPPFTSPSQENNLQ